MSAIKKVVRAVNWEAVTVESVGFMMGILIGVVCGWGICIAYIYFPWGVP